MSSITKQVNRVGVVHSLSAILVRVQRAAARDHSGWSTLEVMQEELEMARELSALPPDPRFPKINMSPVEMYRSESKLRDDHNYSARGGWPTVRIDEVVIFATPYEDGSVAEVKVTYDLDRGAGAVYGVYEDGGVACWAD